MIRKILRAEIRRLKQFQKVMWKPCPVCKTVRGTEKKYKSKHCPIHHDFTPCPLSIQRRCNKVTKIQTRMDYIVSVALESVEEELEKL